MPGWAHGTGLQGRDRPPEGQAKCAADVCMYVFVHLQKCSRMSAFVHVPQRLLWCVCVPCVQPAGTVWGLFFSGPAENWGKAGRMGLPRRPWRVWRSFYSLHNQQNLPKTCWSSQWNWAINKCAMWEIYLSCFKKYSMGGELLCVFPRSSIPPGYL